MKSNLGLSMVESYRLMLQQPQLESLINFSKKEKIKLQGVHIYFVVKIPRILFDKTNMSISNNKLKGNIKIQREDEFEKIAFEYPLDGEKKVLSIQLEYPYEILDILYSDGKMYTKINATIFLTKLLGYSLDANIAYIGQSFGTEGSRNSFDRVPKHSTLQKIYSENRPDTAIWLLLFNFDRNSIGFLPPHSNTKEGAAFNIFQRVISHSRDPYSHIAKNQEVNFTEAALIRYFQPLYNKEFKYNFPSREHTIYSECFKAKLDYISVEIQEDYGLKLGSESIDYNLNHNIFYDLNGKRSFEDMFRIL